MRIIYHRGVYKNLSLPWAKFRNLLIQNFSGVSALNKIHIKIYAVKQKEKEAVRVFLQRKYLLALRLLPQATEKQIVALLLEAFRPSIKKVLRETITSFEELVKRAVQATLPLNANETAATASVRPPPQCHYCSGRHFHKDCPIIKERQNAAVPRNWRDRADEAVAPAAQATASAPPS